VASVAVSKKGKTNAGDKALNGVFYLILLVFSLACLFPFLLVITSSFTEEHTLLVNGYSLFPVKWSTAAYQLIFATGTIFDAYKVTIFVTVVGTALSMLLTSATAYSISIKTFRCRNRIAIFMYFTMLFGGGLVPSYLLISKYLNMRDMIWVLIIPVLVSPWNTLLMRNFFNDIPDSLAESAKLDGAGDLCILFKIILPISKPAIATIGLFYALGYWNEWFNAMLYIDNSKLFPLQYLIMTILRNANFASAEGAKAGIALNIPTYTVRMATIVVTIGPIIFLYPFVQKYFVKGLTIGSIKG
jgi:multiple sugar transport system permease protein/putative aldouronate transport system permease protein